MSNVTALILVLGALAALVFLARGPLHFSDRFGVRGRASRVLIIGDDHLSPAVGHLEMIAKSRGRKLRVTHLIAAARGLREHWEMAVVSQHDPNHPDGSYPDVGMGLAQVLESRGPRWHAVVIQPDFLAAHDAAEILRWARHLQSLVRAYAPTARILINENCTLGDSAEDVDRRGRVGSACREVARKLGVDVAPSGRAYELARRDHMQGRGEAPNPGLYPAQGLDRYATALVLYTAIFNDSPVGCTYRPRGMSHEVARYAQFGAYCARYTTAEPAPVQV